MNVMTLMLMRKFPLVQAQAQVLVVWFVLVRPTGFGLCIRAGSHGAVQQPAQALGRHSAPTKQQREMD